MTRRYRRTSPRTARSRSRTRWRDRRERSDPAREAGHAPADDPRGRTRAHEVGEGRAIGQANYRDWQPKAKSAEIGIGIGEPALWGKGLGREALDLLVRHLVDDLGAHRINLHVLAYNDRAISSYRAAGFDVEGVERDAVMTDRGFYADDVAMAYIKGRTRPSFDPRPVTLTGQAVRLEPLRREHAAELLPVALDEEIWRWYLIPAPRDLAAVEDLIAAAMAEQVRGEQVAFLTRRVSDGAAIGST